MRKSSIFVAAAALTGATLAAVPEAEARPWGWRGPGVGWHAGYARPWGYGGYYRRGWGWGGGAVAAGLAAGAVGGLIASSLATPAYAYSYPAYGYGYPVQTVRTVEYIDPAPVVVRRRVVYRAPVYPRRVIVRRAYRYGPSVAVYRPRAHFYRPVRYHQRVVYGAGPIHRPVRYRAY
jgi:hypothetical protein